MNVTLLTVGSLKERYWREAVAEYEKRLSAYCKFRLIEVKDEKTPDAIDSAASRRVRQKEGGRLLEKIDVRALVVTLEIQGKKFDSEGFAAEMEKLEEMIHIITTELMPELDTAKFTKEGAERHISIGTED